MARKAKNLPARQPRWKAGVGIALAIGFQRSEAELRGGTTISVAKNSKTEFTNLGLGDYMLPALKLVRHSIAEIENKAIGLLHSLEIEDQALKLARRLSGGQNKELPLLEL